MSALRRHRKVVIWVLVGGLLSYILAFKVSDWIVIWKKQRIDDARFTRVQ